MPDSDWTIAYLGDNPWLARDSLKLELHMFKNEREPNQLPNRNVKLGGYVYIEKPIYLKPPMNIIPLSVHIHRKKD